ncbi:ABC transporter substrate-binding protein [Rhodococcus opacus]|nr:ABC transporter substrate-binding protein [Rhodococcus opacus]
MAAPRDITYFSAAKEHTLSHKWIKISSTVLAVATAVFVSGCGSGEPASRAADHGLSGDPIKIGTINPLGTTAQNSPDAVAAIRAAAAGINASGGVNGRPIEIVACNEGYDPNKATACAREMVSENVVATVRDFSINNTSPINNMLASAGIAQVFSSVSQPPDYRAPNVFPLDGGSPFQWAGLVHRAQETHGIKKLAVAYLDGPGTRLRVDATLKAAENAGVQVVTQVPVPADAADYAPYVASVMKDKPDAIVMIFSEPMYAQMIPALDAAGGSEILLLGNQAAVTPHLLKLLGNSAEGMMLGGPLPPLTATDKFPGLAKFKADMATAFQAGDKDADPESTSGAALAGWLGVQAVAQIAANLQGEISRKTVLDALNSTSGVDVQGLLPAWSPGQSGPIESYPRVANTSMFFWEVKDDAQLLTDTNTYDITPALKGF